MKENEVRIGNYVNLKSDFSVHNDYFKVTIENIGWHNEFESIPLTKEWLLKFGFYLPKLDKDYRLYPSFEVQIIADLVDGYAGVMFYTRTIHTDYKPIYITIHYVHQLQNLYFALTNEELCEKNIEK